jgi:hypothetical protein
MGTGEDDSLTNQEAGGGIGSDLTGGVFPDCDDDTDALVVSCLSIIDFDVTNL